MRNVILAVILEPVILERSDRNCDRITRIRLRG